MNKKLIKQILLVFGLMVGALALVTFLSGIANAAGFIDPNVDNPEAVSTGTGGATDLRQLVQTILNYFLGFLGLLAVIMVIYGGVTYVTAAGKDEAVGNAKKIIMYAVVGIIVVLLSFALVYAIFGAGTSAGQ